MRATELCAGFGVSQSTGSAKAKAVRDALGMGQMDPQWYRPSKMEDNPLAWMIMVNGFAVDVRQMPREVQEMAYEKGLIPYVPGTRRGRSALDGPPWPRQGGGEQRRRLSTVRGRQPTLQISYAFNMSSAYVHS